MKTPGWNLSEGTIPFSHQSEADVIRLVNLALSPAKKRTTSYKYAFFKVLLDNLFNADSRTFFLSYDTIALRFTEIYWNLVLKFRLRQMPVSERAEMTAVERKLFTFCDKYGFDCSAKKAIFPFESLRSDLQLEITKQIRAEMLKNVVGAFYGDTEGQLYSFRKSDRGICFNPDAYAACVKYKSDFEKINYYEWIKYLEKVNDEEDAYALAGKLDESTARSDLSAYRTALRNFGQVVCFYCHKPLPFGIGAAAPVDHCIPWSFIKDDKIWNFALACPACNSAKRDILPAENYIEDIKERNARLRNMDLKLVREDFRTYSHERLREIYKSAVFNGFQSGWRPKSMAKEVKYQIPDSGYLKVASPDSGD